WLEGLLLAALAGGAGLLLAQGALRVFSTLNLQELPYGTEISLDATVVVFTSVISLFVGAAIGLLPVLSSLPRNPAQVRREEGRTVSGGRGARALRRSLVVAQVAFTFVLLIGAGLLLQSFRRVLAIDPGFVADRVLTASVTLPRSRYKDEAALRAF